MTNPNRFISHVVPSLRSCCDQTSLQTLRSRSVLGDLFVESASKSPFSRSGSTHDLQVVILVITLSVPRTTCRRSHRPHPLTSLIQPILRQGGLLECHRRWIMGEHAVSGCTPPIPLIVSTGNFARFALMPPSSATSARGTFAGGVDRLPGWIENMGEMTCLPYGTLAQLIVSARLGAPRSRSLDERHGGRDHECM